MWQRGYDIIKQKQIHCHMNVKQDLSSGVSGPEQLEWPKAGLKAADGAIVRLIVARVMYF